MRTPDFTPKELIGRIKTQLGVRSLRLGVVSGSESSATEIPSQPSETDKRSKFAFGKYGLAENPRNHHVSLTWQGRTILGTVQDAEYDQVRGYTFLTVRHFNGEPWPIKPSALAVEVIR